MRKYGEWAITLDVRVEMKSGLVKTWSEELRAVGREENVCGEAESRLDERLRGDWPDWYQIEVEARSARLVVERDEMGGR